MAYSKYGLAIYGLNVYGGIPTIEFDYHKPGKRVLFVKRKDTEFKRRKTLTTFLKESDKR